MVVKVKEGSQYFVEDFANKQKWNTEESFPTHLAYCENLNWEKALKDSLNVFEIINEELIIEIW